MPKSSVGATERQRQAKEWACRQQASIPQRKRKHNSMHNSVHNRNTQQHARQHTRKKRKSTLDVAKDSGRGPNWLKIGAAERRWGVGAFERRWRSWSGQEPRIQGSERPRTKSGRRSAKQPVAGEQGRRGNGHIQCWSRWSSGATEHRMGERRQHA